MNQHFPVETASAPDSDQETPNKRLRINRACDFCRRKKVKCHITPGNSCSTCLSYNVTCEFSDKKRPPPKGFIDGLEKRIQRIESLLKTGIGDRRKINTSIPQGDYAIRPFFQDKGEVLLGPVLSKGQGINSLRAVGLTSPLTLLQNKMPLGKLNELMRKPGHRYQQYGRELVEVPEETDGSHLFPDAVYLQNGVNFWIYATSGVDRHTSDRLMKIYFLNIHPFLPVVDKIEFLKQYRDQSETYPASELLNAMYGAAARFVELESLLHNKDQFNRPETLWEVPRGWPNHFFEQVESFLLNHPQSGSMATMQAMIIMHNTNNHPDETSSASWLRNGLTVRLGQGLGLNRSCEEWNIPEHEKEARRRTWWALFIVDRFQAAALGRPISIREEDNDVELPSIHASWREILDEPDDDDRSQPRFPSATYRPASIDGKAGIYQAFNHLVKLSDILGRILVGLYTPVARKTSLMQGSDDVVAMLDHELTEWRYDFLATSRSTQHRDFDEKEGYFSAYISCTMLSYFACLIMLHRPFIESESGKNSGQHQKKARPSLRICTSAASCGIDIAERMSAHDFVMCSYAFNTYPIFQFILIHLYNSQNADVRIAEQSKNDVKKGVMVLKQVQDVSERTRQMCRLVETVISYVGSNEQADLVDVDNKKATTPDSGDSGRGPDASIHIPSKEEQQQQQPLSNNTTTMTPISPSVLHMPRQSPEWSPSRANSASSTEAYTIRQFGYDAYSSPIDSGRGFDHIMAQQELLLPIFQPALGNPQQEQQQYLSQQRQPSEENAYTAVNNSSLHLSNDTSDIATPITGSSTTNLEAPAADITAVYNTLPPFADGNNVNGNIATADDMSFAFRTNPDNPFSSIPSSIDRSEWSDWMMQNGYGVWNPQ